jgi:hypothetical protein
LPKIKLLLRNWGNSDYNNSQNQPFDRDGSHARRRVKGHVGDERMIEGCDVSRFNNGMTALLEKAINRMSGLPSKQQNEIARFVLTEIDAEAKWDTSFKNSQDELADLAAGALAERRRGKTKKLDLAHDL